MQLNQKEGELELGGFERPALESNHPTVSVSGRRGYSFGGEKLRAERSEDTSTGKWPWGVLIPGKG